MTVEGGSVKAQQATPEPPSKKIASNASSQAVAQVATNSGAHNQNQNSLVIGSRLNNNEPTTTNNAMTADPTSLMAAVLDSQQAVAQ